MSSGAGDSGLGPVLLSPWALVLVVLLSFYWQLGAVPLYDLDEGAFSEATREMLASGNFITPHKDGEPRYDKPVLIYWAQALSVRLLGLNEFALRLPSALAATLWVAALWGFTRARLDAATATVAALAMALSLQVTLIAKAAVADALLNLFLALTFFEVWRYAHNASPESSARALLRAYLWMGLGFLTKGPVAVVLPLLVSALHVATLGAWRRWFAALWAPRGWLIFLALVLPWHLAILLDDGLGFFGSFFLEHNAGRFTGVMHGHGGFPGYYLVMLPIILLPFSGWFLVLLAGLRRAWADPLERFLWLWFVCVLVFFSFSRTQLPHYLLYGCTPLFILLARHRAALTASWLAFGPLLGLLLLLLALPALLPLAIAQAEGIHVVAQLELAREQLGWSWLLGVLAALGVLLALWRWSGPPLWQRLLLAGVVQVVVVYGLVVPAVFAVMQGPVKEAALLARALDRPTLVYRTSMPSFSLYREAITPHRAPQAGDLVFLRRDKLERLRKDYPDLVARPLFERGAVALVEMEPAGDG